MMRKTSSLILLMLFACFQNLLAQEDAIALMDAYDFNAAAKVLRTQISQARNAGQPTTALEQQLRQAEQGDRMLQATERVVFIDSIVIPAESVLNKLHISTRSGRITTPAAYFSMGLPDGFVNSGTMAVNDFGDRITLAQPDSNGLSKLHSSYLLAGQWTAPKVLAGLENSGEIQDYPFLMPDGQTLYFAAQGPSSLGGYDIFVTRYDRDTGHYLKPAHLGFPFNSTANDYLFCIDEATGVGYFATDRSQPAGYVCLYAFIPSTTHDIYMLTEENADTIRRAARIASIDELGANSEEATAARKHARQILAQEKEQATTPVKIVIDDSHVYTDASQLKNETAARIATEYVNRVRELRKAENELDAYREQYAADRSPELGQRILQYEQHINQLRESINRLAKNMRQAEYAQ